MITADKVCLFAGELQRFCVRHKYRREELSLDDGGLIGLDWFKWSQCRALPQTAPILLVLHFITGMLSIRTEGANVYRCS